MALGSRSDGHAAFVCARHDVGRAFSAAGRNLAKTGRFRLQAGKILDRVLQKAWAATGEEVKNRPGLVLRLQWTHRLIICTDALRRTVQTMPSCDGLIFDRRARRKYHSASIS